VLVSDLVQEKTIQSVELGDKQAIKGRRISSLGKSEAYLSKSTEFESQNLSKVNLNQRC
jgi:hypothetical protein